MSSLNYKIRNLKYKVRNFIQSVKRLRRWIPIIWDDRNWDYWYIYEMLKNKLQDMEIALRLYGSHEDNEYDAEKIRTAIKLIDRVQNEYYTQEYYDNAGDKLIMEDVKKAIAKQRKAQRILFNFLDHHIDKWWN